MAKFKCKNCGKVFEHFCDSELDTMKIKCPNCKSHWIEIVNYNKGFNPLPHTNPYTIPYFVPTPNTDPWVPSKYWCGISYSKPRGLHNDAVFSRVMLR